jgi:DNA-binding protein HU-beta
MNKTELIEDVANKAGLTKPRRKMSSQLWFLPSPKRCQWRQSNPGGVWVFEPKVRSAREGRNPQTGETIQIPAARVPTFSAGKAFREAVNK